jgi:restriction endonuclease SmaI-like protein
VQNDLSSLTPSQHEWVDSVVGQFKLPHTFWRDPMSQWMTEQVVERLGDAMRIHHAFSRQALSKDRFEYAFERALTLSGIPSRLEDRRTNPGHDITVAGVPISLKTEAAANIKLNEIHVSKWMELGKGEWDLALLRDRFLDHCTRYDHILTLRCIARVPKADPTFFKYELVEIPKALMLEAKHCHLEVMTNSKQNPQPGYGYIHEPNGLRKFSLYFDGGSERKLQIKHLRKDLCQVHATWEFESTAL